jgi:hypothetical protein
MVQRIAPLPDSLIARHQARTGGFADSFRTIVPVTTDLAGFVTTFYTTRLFRAERWMLARAGQPSTDAQIAALFDGTGTEFAVWRIADCTENELLMQEKSGATASWFRASPCAAGTELYFGSAVRPGGSGRALPPAYRLLLGLHLAYSRALLSSAARRVSR